MPIEVVLDSPLATALQREVQTKIVASGWAPSDASDATMAEYLVLMVINGKTEDEIASEVSSDLLGLGPEDNSGRDFARWLFETIDTLNAEINGPPQPAPSSAPVSEGGDQDMDMDLAQSDAPKDVNAPTGPKAMRNGSGGFRGGRDKRVMGQINRAMDRSNDSILHRIRGQGGATDRINTHAAHARGAQLGARGGFGGRMQQQQRNNVNGRIAANLGHHAVGMPMGPPGVGMMPWMGAPGGPPGPPGQPGPMDVYAMLEQQSRMMQQMQEQMQQQQNLMKHQVQGRGGSFNNRNSRPLADRIQNPHKNFRNGGQPHHPYENGGNNGGGAHTAGSSSGDATASVPSLADMDMLTDVSTTPLDPAETVCKFNLHCTNKDCKFAHQSPAAPPGVTVDVHDVCTYGAACKNKKCVARHPSPAARMAHQSEMDCKFYPNCTNPHCPFRHPTMPLCRNGGDCSVPGCKFTHIKTMCRFRPCTNRYCTFKHEEGQRGTFPDKVWTADGSNSKEHISERKFVDESAPEETILPDASDAGAGKDEHGGVAGGVAGDAADFDKAMASEDAVIS